MTRKNKKTIILLVFILFLYAIISLVFCKTANAEGLSDSIDQQLGNLDYSKLEDFFNSLNVDNS